MTKTKKVPGKSAISAFMEYGQACHQRPVVRAKSGLFHKSKSSLVARSEQLAFPPVITHNQREGRRESAKAALSFPATEGAFQFSSVLFINSQPVQISKSPKEVVNKKKKKGSVQKVNHQLSETILPNGFGFNHSQIGVHSSANKPDRRNGKVQCQPDNPISAFMEYGRCCQQQPVLDVVGQSGPSHKPIFTIIARIGQRAFPPIVSRSKKEGRREAAEVALHILAVEDAFQSSSGPPVNSQSVLTKSCVHAISQKSKKLVKQDVDKKKKKKRKKGSLQVGEDHLPEKNILPNGLNLEYPQNGQQSNLQGKKGKVQLQPSNPISTFMEYGQSCRQQPVLEVVGQSGPAHKPRFTVVARIGQRAFPEVVSDNKKDGRREAAKVALLMLAAEGTFQSSSGLPSNNQPVVTKNSAHAVSKRSKKPVTQGVKKNKKKKGSAQKLKDQIPVNAILPNSLTIKKPPVGQHSRTDKAKSNKGKVQLRPNNPISAFMEYGQACRKQPVLEVVGQSGPAHKPKFTVIARIGQRSFPPVVSENKKDGRREAAEAALRTLAAEGALQFSSRVSSDSEPVQTKCHVHMTSKKLKKVVSHGLSKKKKGSAQKVKDQLPEKIILPKDLRLRAKYLESGQHSSAGNSEGVREKVQLQPNNPISAFMEYGQSCQQQPVLEVVAQSGPAHKPKFTIVARIGQRAFPPVVSENKKDGRREAAKVALRILADEGSFHFSSGRSNNSQPVQTKSLKALTGKMPKNVLNQGLTRKAKKASVHKTKDQLPAEISSPSDTDIKYSQNAQHCSAKAVQYEPTKLFNKNPISAFIEFGQSNHQKPVLELIGKALTSNGPKFIFIARIGKRTFPPVVTHNKKDGRREAAEAALRTLAAEGAFQFSSRLSKNSQPGFEATSFYDHIASLAHQAFSDLVVDIPECFSGKKVISALILKMDHSDSGRVIALGTGNRCVTGDKLSLEGQTVQDSHAEVVTRRAFMRYMYRQLKMYKSNPAMTILSPSPSGKLTLKEGCSLHLYISTAPCGDGAQFSWTDNQGNQEGPSGDLDFSGHANHCPTIEKNIQGLLRTKMELGEGTIPIQEENPVQTWDAIMQNQQRLRTMSCSDKVCRWNILGLQGSLLTHFVEPMYLSSLTLGTLYHHGHLSRAVCCRLTHCLKSLEKGLEELPPGYRINHPQLGHVTSPEPPRGTEKTKEFSVNWYAGCDNAEVTDGTVGRIKGVTPSRLCKMNLLKEFIEVCMLYNSPILHSDLDTYNNIKLTAEDFQKAKAFMKNLFRKGKYGTWVEKPVEVEMFPP